MEKNLGPICRVFENMHKKVENNLDYLISSLIRAIRLRVIDYSIKQLDI